MERNAALLLLLLGLFLVTMVVADSPGCELTLYLPFVTHFFTK